MVFTRSATGALKLVGETYPWSSSSTFAYLRENHNSVLGMREYALDKGGHFQAMNETAVEAWIAEEEGGAGKKADGGWGEGGDGLRGIELKV